METISPFDFAKKHNVKLSILDESYGKYFDDDSHERSIFKVKLSRNGKSYTFKYGQAIVRTGEAPNIGDIIECLTKYYPGDFKNFCYEFGYSDDSIKDRKTYKAVLKEFNAVERLFSDCMDELQSIE